MFIDPGVDLVIDRAGHDDLQRSVAVQVIGGQPAQFTVGWLFRPARFKVSLVGIDRDVATTVGSDDLQVVVPIHVGDDNAGPGAADVVGVGFGAIVARFHTPLEIARRSVQDDDRIGRANDFDRTVTVQIGHGGGGIPAGLAPGGVAAAALPLEDRGLDGLGLS